MFVSVLRRSLFCDDASLTNKGRTNRKILPKCQSLGRKWRFRHDSSGILARRKPRKAVSPPAATRKNAAGKTAQAPDGGSPPQATSRNECNRFLQTAAFRAARATAFGGEGPLRVPRRLQPAITYAPTLSRASADCNPSFAKMQRLGIASSAARTFGVPVQPPKMIIPQNCDPQDRASRSLPRAEARYTRPAGYDSPSTEQPFFLFMGSGSKKVILNCPPLTGRCEKRFSLHLYKNPRKSPLESGPIPIPSAIRS